MVVLGALALAPGGAHADDATDAKALIQNLADKALSALTSTDISKQERRGRFRSLLIDNFDIKTIAPWVLGRAWNNASADERADYLKLFEDLIVSTYADRFERYSGEKVSIGDATGKAGEDYVVPSFINRPEAGQRFRVDWRVRRREGRMWIVDIIVEGVSMGQTQRSEFASAIREYGGIRPFLTELRKRVDAGA
jgi:phospholipid transport system substrate-binding protein